MTQYASPVDTCRVLSAREGFATTELESVQTRPLERRNQRLLLVGLACYGLLVTTLMLQGGVAITPDVAVVALGLAGVLLLSGRLHLASWLPLIALGPCLRRRQAEATAGGRSLLRPDASGPPRPLRQTAAAPSDATEPAAA
jgi:hypothetical protein